MIPNETSEIQQVIDRVRAGLRKKTKKAPYTQQDHNKISVWAGDPVPSMALQSEKGGEGHSFTAGIGVGSTELDREHRERVWAGSDGLSFITAREILNKPEPSTREESDGAGSRIRNVARGLSCSITKVVSSQRRELAFSC